jgi:hypothetical protein
MHTCENVRHPIVALEHVLICTVVCLGDVPEDLNRERFLVIEYRKELNVLCLR